ncbi:MAG: MgtC/SapB family protein [Saprospiraceae bacterium]|nr:MgtC/SapB family protein [Saprospiraceae bacterium]
MFEIDWPQITFNLTQLGIAFVLAIPVAYNREHKARGAGLRTFPLVSIASCAYMLLGMAVFEGDDATARVTYGIITGMGFIGGGAILKTRGTVLGTATAASIWNTGAIGISVAQQLYEIALLLSLINFLILRFATPLKRKDKAELDEDQPEKEEE